MAGGFRISLKDVLSKEAVDTLEKVAKTYKKPRRGRITDEEVEVKNDRGNPLPVTVTDKSFKFVNKLSNKISKVESMIGKAGVVGENKMFSGLSDIKDNLDRIQKALSDNVEAINKAGEVKSAEKLSTEIKEAVNQVVLAIKSGDLKDTKRAVEAAQKVNKDTKDFKEKVEGMSVSLSEVLAVSDQIMKASNLNLHQQRLAAQETLTILTESGYKNQDLLLDLKKAVLTSSSKQLKATIEAINQDKENYEGLNANTKKSEKALEHLVDLNTEMLADAHERTLQELLAQKWKKTAALGKTDIGGAFGGAIGSLLGVPALGAAIAPLLEIINATGMAAPLAKFMTSRVGGGIMGGIASAGFTGYDRYQQYQKAKAAGASEDELSKLKVKGISATVGSGIGGAAGAFFGSLLGPVGTVLGGMIGAKGGELLGDFIGDALNSETAAKIGKSIKEKVEKSIEWLKEFWDEIVGIFDGVKKWVDKLLENPIIKTALLMAVNPVAGAVSAGGMAMDAVSNFFGQKSTPTVTPRTMDNQSSVLDKQELENRRKNLNNTSPVNAPIISPITPSSSPQGRNTTPYIDDYGLSFMNSVVFN